MLDPKMVSRDCLHLLAVAFDGLRAVTSRRVEGTATTATSLIATTDCLRLLVIAFDRSCAIVCAICDGESYVTSLCAMASRHVEDTTTALRQASSLPHTDISLRGEVLSKKGSF